MTLPNIEPFLIDPLTGCQNRLAFEYAINRACPEVKWKQNTSLVYCDFNNLKMVNNINGHTYGDSVLRWLGILMAEESGEVIYRYGGNNFAFLITSGTFADHEQVLQDILERIEKESKTIEGISNPAVHFVLTHHKKDSLSTPTIAMLQLDEALYYLKSYTRSVAYRIFMAEELKVAEQAAALEQNMTVESDDSEAASRKRWLITHYARQVMHTESVMSRTIEALYTDPVSDLPNMRAALQDLENKLQSVKSIDNGFSILLMDGDNIRAYNNINYAEGDKLIHEMGVVFKENLRPHDFVARWRTGDEFIVILPETSGEGARVVAERFRLAIKDASQNWIFPTSITIGIATFPIHGNTVSELVDKAEGALKKGKDAGKDQVVLAE